jgi:protein-serine/threonine kinase
MLAGYLPFDDDPANPEGDNINLLYKYIVSTPLTFPEYVTPHARDLLRRILVPDPRKRADLFEVARHSWLSEYSNIVGFITSSTSTPADIATTTIGSAEQEAAPLARSSSVREPSKSSKPAAPAVGELGRKHGGVDPDSADSHPKPSKDAKRRTVQVEYVAPRSQTQRGELATAAGASSGSSRTRARAGSTGPVEVPTSKPPQTRRQVSVEKPLPRDPPVSSDAQYTSQSQGRRPSSTTRQQGMPPPARQGPSRTASDTHTSGSAQPPVSMARPNTGGSMASIASRQGMPLNNRGSYSQPVAPTVAGSAENALGRMSQPKGANQYNISQPMLQDEGDYGRPSSQQVPTKFAQVAGLDDEQQVTTAPPQKGHKRSSTIGGFFSRTNSVFGSKSVRKESQSDRPAPEKQKKYPPVSMSGANAPGQATPRQSMDSRRSISFGFGKKRSGSINGSNSTLQDKPRRFSLLPASFSLKSIGIGKEYGTPGAPPSDYDYRPESRGNNATGPPTAHSNANRSVSGTTGIHPSTADGSYERQRDSPSQDRRGTSTGSPSQQRYVSQGHTSDPRSGVPPQFLPPMNFRQDDSVLSTESESSLNNYQSRRGQPPTNYPAQGYANDYDSDRRPTTNTTVNSRGNGRGGVLQKNNRKFTDAYEQETNNGYGPTHNDHAGSSGAARKVMDFFRRRGRDRASER